MNEGTKLDFSLSDFILEMSRRISESPVPIEVSIKYHPDGEVDVNISPYRPITYNCPCNFPLQYPCPTIPYPFTTTPNN